MGTKTRRPKTELGEAIVGYVAKYDAELVLREGDIFAMHAIRHADEMVFTG